ncbi:MAG: putative glycoside hydrolase [Bacilli bacterium]|nr:putative glycoside hydrolase [Bacilli bacterium]
MAKKRLKIKKRNIIIIIILIVIAVLYYFINNNQNHNTTSYVKGNTKVINLYNEDLIEKESIKRGTEVIVINKTITNKNDKYHQIKYNNQTYYIKMTNLTKDKKDLITEEKIYVRTPATIYEDINKGSIKGLADKGKELAVLNYDKINEDGSVNIYQIKDNDQTGYIYGKYTVLTKEEALEHYEPDKYYNVHNERGDRFGGGHAGNLDYYPVIKPTFKDNIMPDKVYALYLNSSRSILEKVDNYIEFAKTTKINAFVVDIKDNQSPGYKSKVFEKYSPTNYKYANNSFESYKNVINKLKTAGFYVIGRITVFKDKYYVMDNPDVAIIDNRTNEPFLHADTYWPSPYQRKVWEFNIELAKEAVKEMGFNEIQFDYVRFPDRTISYEEQGHLSFKNDYNEDKAQAIQRFFMYAGDELHQLNVYVAADVFGETAYNYVTAYGQYWPSISNVVDVISGMPYPDHFNKYEFGFKEPVWTVPYELLKYWGENYVIKRQSEIPTPAIMRTWIQAADVPSYKHPGGYSYGEEQIEAQIKGLFDAGLNKGYMTWLSHSKLERYQSYQNVYSKEY